MNEGRTSVTVNPKHHGEFFGVGVATRHVGRPNVEIRTIFSSVNGVIRFEGLNHFLG
jgi:hypothetical protein